MSRTDAVPVDLEDVQGLVVSAYSHLSAARLVLLHLHDGARGRAWLRTLLDAQDGIARGTSAAATARGPRAVNVAFTSVGLMALGVSSAHLRGLSLEFQEGMDTPHRARLLGDEGPSGRERWAWGRDDADPLVHAALLLYGERDVEQVAAASVPDAQTASVVASLPLELLRRDSDDGGMFLEHFGFHDGLSQPVYEFAPNGAAPGEAPLAAGEVLLGHRNEYGEISPAPAHDGVALGLNGSYLVVRQLAQDVGAFWQHLDEAGRRAGMAREELAARMVGRRLNGEPLARGARGRNDFGFADDPLGEACPIGAHMRRSNPRDWIPGQPPAGALAQTRKHRLLRRGRPYGPPADRGWNIDAIVRGEVEAGERGLVFACLNADIARQFEFVQSNWVMSPKFGELERDADPIMGARPRTMTIRVPNGRIRLRALPRFVELRGGAYFLLPGMRALEAVASGAARA